MWTFFQQGITFWNRIDPPIEMLKRQKNGILIANFNKKGKRFHFSVERTYYLTKNYLFYGDRCEVSNVFFYYKFGKIGTIKASVYLGFIYVHFECIGADYNIIFNNSGNVVQLFTQNEQQFIKWKEALSKICIQFSFYSHYELKENIYTGSSCQVNLNLYQSKKVKICQKKTDKSISCVKIIRKRQVESRQQKIQLQNLAHVLQNVQHFSILKLQQVISTIIFEDEQFFYLVTDYYDGGELISDKYQNRLMSVASIRVILYRLLDGLKAMHDFGYIHRNITPSKILFKNQKDQLQVAFVGLGKTVKIVDDNELFIRLQPNEQCSDQFILNRFSSPEISSQMYDGKKFNEKSDVYSMGIVFFTLMFGYNPIKGQKINESQTNLLVTEFPNDSSIPEEAKNLLRKMLHFKAKQRISVHEALQHEFFYEKIASQRLLLLPWKVLDKAQEIYLVVLQREYNKNATNRRKSVEEVTDLIQNDIRKRSHTALSKIKRELMITQAKLQVASYYKIGQKTTYEVSFNEAEKIGSQNITMLRRNITQ